MGLPGQAEARLSAEAKQLLKEASKASNGMIIKLNCPGLCLFLTNQKTFVGKQVHTNAKWQYALDQLVNNNYAIPRGFNDEFFEVSLKGYKLAGILPDDKQ